MRDRHLGVLADRRERGAQLMRRVGDEAAADAAESARADPASDSWWLPGARSRPRPAGSGRAGAARRRRSRRPRDSSRSTGASARPIEEPRDDGHDRQQHGDADRKQRRHDAQSSRQRGGSSERREPARRHSVAPASAAYARNGSSSSATDPRSSRGRRSSRQRDPACGVLARSDGGTFPIEHLDEDLVGVTGGEALRIRTGLELGRRARAARTRRSARTDCRSSDRSRNDDERDGAEHDHHADDEHRRRGGAVPRTERAADQSAAMGLSRRPLRGGSRRRAGSRSRCAPERSVDLVAAGGRRRPRRCSGRPRSRSPTRGRGSRAFETTSPRAAHAGTRATPSSRAVSAISTSPRQTRRAAGSRRRSPASSTAGRSRAPAAEQGPQPRHEHGDRRTAW